MVDAANQLSYGSRYDKAAGETLTVEWADLALGMAS
jgi:hypothetical protein